MSSIYDGKMRPCIAEPLEIRGLKFGGPRPLFCIPIVAIDEDQLMAQATVAKSLSPDIVEWRADSFSDLSAARIVKAASRLRSVLEREAILFTLRIAGEGGKGQISQKKRAECIDATLRSGHIDLVDVELANGSKFLDPLIATASALRIPVILSFHDFAGTPSESFLLKKITAMIQMGASVAKVACMPKSPDDVLKLLRATLTARQMHPTIPLCTMSMGSLGSVTRVAGSLFGSDMTFAVGQEISAPGQIPLLKARELSDALLFYAKGSSEL